MKRIFFTVFIVVIGCVALNATQLTTDQIKAKKEIYAAIQKYGTDISDSGEESIFF